MKFIKVITVATLTLALLLSFAACASNGEEQPTTEVTEAPEVTTTPAAPNLTIHIQEGESLPAIKDGSDFSDLVKTVPTKEGYAFAGWYSDEALTDYIIPDNITTAQIQKASLYPKWIKVDTVSYTVRTEEITINDSGRINQPMDIAYLSQNFNMTDLTRAGYTKLKVDVSIEIKEVNDGYQHLFLYSDTKCAKPDSVVDAVEDKLLGDDFDEILGTKDEGDPSLLMSKKFDHGADDKDTTWGYHTASAYINIADLTDELYVRYGASGKNEDDWTVKNVVVTVTPQK